MPFVSEKKAYPSYEELREEVAKSKGATKLVAESEKPFAELWCVEDKTSGPQQIEKITLASIIDKAFSSMDTDEDCVGDGRRLGEDSVSNRKAQNQRASDDKGLQSRKEDRLNLLEPTSKYQGQFYKYLQRNSDAPNPMDNRTMEQLGYSTKMACSKAVQHKKKPNPHKKLPLVVDPNGEDLPDPVLQDVSLMKASRGSSIPVQSQTPVTGRSPFMHQSVPDPCQLLNSDVLDPRIKSSSKDYEHSIHEQEETDTQGGSKMNESIEKDKGRDKGWELESVTQRREDVGLMESQSSLDSQPSSASKSDSSQMDQDISDQIPTLTKEIECRTDLLDDIGRNSSTAKSSENLSLIKSNLSCPKLSVSDFTETKQPQSSKSVLNLSWNQNTPTIPQNSEKCVESPGESEGGPPSNTGSDLENMLPLSENKSEPETQSRNTCVFEGHKFEGHMTRSRSSSESNSRWQTNEDGVKKNHSETDVEKTRKSVRISRESRKRKREIPGVDYFVTGKFKGHKRMTVQLNKLNISNGTVVKLSQVFSLNSLYQKNGSNHKTVQAPEMAAHEPFCDNIFEKFKSFQDSKFFGNIVSDDSSKDSTYFQPRKSRLSLLKRGRPNDEVIEISSSEDEGRGKKVTTATEKEWGMNDSVICVEEDEYDDEMEDEKESDENSLSKTVKPSQKFIKKKKKTNKCRKIHTAFNGASYRTRKRRTRSCSGKLMTSLSVLHQATLANLIDSPLSYCESTDDYRTKYDDALFSMSLYSPPPPDELEKSPPRAQSPTDLKDIAGSPEITNVFSDLCKAMMSDDESRSPVYSPVKTKRAVLVRLNESPLKIPLGDSFEEPEIGSEKIQKGRVSVLNIHDVKRQGNDDKAKESSGYNNVGSGHHLDRSTEPVLDEPLRDEEHGAHSSDTDRDNHRTEQNTGPRLGPLHIKRKAIVRLRPLTDREIQSYCLNPAGAGKENIPVVSERESVSPPDLGPPIIPKFGKDLKQELECPPRLIRSDSYIDLYEDEAPGCLDPGSAREQDLVTSNDKFSEVYHAKKLAQKDHSRKVKGSKEESVPNSGSSETSPGGLSPTKLGAGNKTEGGHQEKTTLPRRRRPSQQGGGGERIPHSLTPTKRQVLKPKHPPPSRLRVEGTAKQYGLQCVVNQDAFCSNANDVPEKPREVGGRVLTLQNNRVTSFLEYLSTVTGEGLAAFRQILAATDRILPSQTDNQTVMDSITRDHNLRCSLLGDRRVTMVPCKLPPSQAKVRLWLEKKELYRKQRRKEKAQKQQQCNPQENQQSNPQKNQFTKIVPLIHYSQIKDKDTVRTPKTKLITKEVSFNETAEIFNMEDEVSPGEKNGVSCDKEGTELSMEEKSGSGMSSQESGDDIIGPSPPQQTCCSFRREEEEVISPSPPQLTHHSFRRDTGNIISPSPSKLTMPSVRRTSQQSGKSLTSKSRLSQLSSEEKKQSCDAVRRNLIGSVHSTPVSSRDQRSLLETINVTPISHSTDNDPENPRKRLETPGVFLTPKRVPLPSKESVEKGDPRRSLMSSADMREMATPTNSKGNQSQIDGPTPKNSFGFKVSQHDFQKAKALHEVQNLTVMSLELHAETRRDLMPDPEVDPILAVFYNIVNDVTTDAQQRDITGVILVDKKSKEIQSAIKNRKKSTQPDPPSPQPSTSRDTGSEVKPSPQPSTSRPLSPQPSTSRAPTQRGKRPRSVSPTPSPGAKIPRGEAEHTLLQKSGVDDLEVVYVENEEELFMEVLKLFSRWDPDILVGFEIQKFSWGYLLQRASQLSVNLCAQMSRIPDEKKKSSFKAESDEWGSDHSSEIHIAGRVILNLWRIIRHEVTLNIYTFENVAHHVIHQRVPHFSLQTLNSWFKHRTHLYRWRFIKYYLTRVQGNLKVIDQLDLIGRTSEFARVFGIEFYHVLSRGSQYRVESMMLRLAKPMNFIPASPSVQQRARMRAPECIALTLEPESRFYADPVVVVDFQSLYPSIMIAHNYCFSTCVGRLDLLEKAHEGPIEFGCAHLRISPKTLNRIKNDVTVSPNGVVFVKEHIRKGIISKMVEEILNTRIMVKKSMKEHKNDKGLHRLLDARQLGLKLIANVTYGYTAASFSGRMPCVEVADSIVRKARETLERAIKLVEERPEWGARVVYGDTDSMFIEMKGRSKEEAFRIGHEICDAVTAMNPQPIKLKFEKVYYPCVLQTKKRYVGYSYETLDQKEPVFDAKGIETVRRDSCAAVSKILERSIKILFGCKDVSKVKEYVLRQCRKFMEGKVSMQDCVFAKEYRGMKGYKPGACVPALEIAKKLLRHDRRSEPRTGERVPYVIIYGSPGLPLIQLVRQPGEVLSDPALRLNATYYITKQILPPLDRVFSLLGVDVFSWYNDMPKVVRVVPQSLMAPDQRKGTISQYFSATNCPVCDKQTNQPICNSCVKDPQHVCVTLCDRIRRWEKVYHDLVQVCNTCMGVKDESQPCVSLDCPIMFRRVLAKQDVQKGTQLREVVNKVLDF